MKVLQFLPKPKFVVASLVVSLGVIACNDGSGFIEPDAPKSPNLVRESASQWRLSGSGGRTITVTGNRVRINGGTRVVELSAETSALFRRILATVEKGDSLAATHVGNPHIRRAANQAELERARQNSVLRRARQQPSNGFGMASMEEDPCLDVGLELYDATEDWRPKRDAVVTALAAFSFNMLINYLYDQSGPGLADLVQLGQFENELLDATVEMEFWQIEFGLLYCFGPYQ